MNPTAQSSGPVSPDLNALVALFYETSEALGRFVEMAAEELPEPYRRLLAHTDHMTVSVEAFHRSPVDVRVLETRLGEDRYSRKILLTRQSDGQVVQFGIMRIDLSFVSEDAREAVLSEKIPLGRILIDHGILRQIELARLWRIEPGEALRALFGQTTADSVYGRTALIHCNGQPAVELLEIVAPV